MKWTQLNQLPILKNSEFHYLIDTEEYDLHPNYNKDTLIELLGGGLLNLVRSVALL